MNSIGPDEQSNIDFEKLAKMDLDQKMDCLERYFKDKDFIDDYQRLPQELMLTYYNGYLNSVIELLPKIKNERSLFFPFTFLLSHYMELWIKTMGLFHGLDFDDDMKDLGITGHDLKSLILAPEQLSKLSDRGIKTKEIKKIMILWDYFEKLTDNNTKLSIAMRYPITTKDNFPTIKNYKDFDDFDVNEYISNASKIISITLEIYLNFMANRTVEHLEAIKSISKFLK